VQQLVYTVSVKRPIWVDTLVMDTGKRSAWGFSCTCLFEIDLIRHLLGHKKKPAEETNWETLQQLKQKTLRTFNHQNRYSNRGTMISRETIRYYYFLQDI